MKELKTLRDAAPERVLLPSPSAEGLICSICAQRCWGLLRNDCCEHAACLQCWQQWAEASLEICQDSHMLRPRCLGAMCEHPMSESAWRHVARTSRSVGRFVGDADELVRRLRATAGSTLLWAPMPSEPGPICSICSEQHWALLRNTACNHAACEDCWTPWIAGQLPLCRGKRQPHCRCLGEGCTQLMGTLIWSHACTRSSDIQSLEKIFQKRRRLQDNELFPPCMQVECPRAECLGIAYSGFDSLMCFFCEHQWEETGQATEDMHSVGDALADTKACPKCGVCIEKNGGCDHMTCRLPAGCGFEFRWSTLEPYRR